MARLQRRFQSREELTGSFLRRLSKNGMEVELPGHPPLPAGATIDLDLRLADGSPLIVGLGKVGAGEEGGVRRIRFVQLDEASQAELPGLVALSGAAGSRRAEEPAVGTRDPDETLEALVAGVFGERRRRLGPDETVLVPPEPAAEPAPAVAEAPVPPLAIAAQPVAARAHEPMPAPAVRPTPAPATPAELPPAAGPRPAAARRPSLFRRLQVSPAVIVASIIAGATGAAANAWLEDLANVFADADSRATDSLVAAPVVDVVPVDVKPSRFPEPAAAPEPGEPPTPAPVPTTAGTAPPPDLSAAPELAPAATPADRVRLITWDEQASGTVVTFWGNGEFLPDRVARIRVAGSQPRELVKLRGIDVPFPQTVLELGTPEVVRVRTGFHPQEPVNELHVVLDLAGPDVVLDHVETAPQQLRLHLRREGAPAASQDLSGDR
jgi:hypothetical protein